jgi:hypothetical protein
MMLGTMPADDEQNAQTVPAAGGSVAGPIGSIKNTATRWMTGVNYDLLIYRERIVVARGFSYRDVKEHRQALRDADVREANAARVARAAALDEVALLAQDPGNRVIPVEEIASAILSQRLGICTLRLELASGERVKYRWMNSAKKATALYDARSWLIEALGIKLGS